MGIEGEDNCVEDFFKLLFAKIPRMRGDWEGQDLGLFLKKRVLFIVNEEPCIDPYMSLKDGDRIQILTPVTGG